MTRPRQDAIRFFLVLTAIELLGRLLLLGYTGLGDGLGSVLFGLAAAFSGGVRVLTPAVILWRPRSGRLDRDWLLFGFAILAVAELATTVTSTVLYVGARGGSVGSTVTFSYILGVGITAARIIGAVLVSVGLAATTGPRPGQRPRHRSIGAAIVLTLIVAVTAGFELQLVERLGLYATLINGTFVSILADLAWAVTAWLAITARNGPWRRSLLPLAAGAIAILFSDLLAAVYLALAFAADGVSAIEDASAIGLLGSFVEVGSSILIVVAADRGLPGPTRNVDPRDANLPPPPPPPRTPAAAPLERPWSGPPVGDATVEQHAPGAGVYGGGGPTASTMKPR